MADRKSKPSRKRQNPERPLSYGRQWIDDADVQAVVEALRSDYLTQGPAIARFEEAFAARVGRRFAVAFANGTAALHGAYAALSLAPGKTLLTTPMTFAATANAALYLGAGVRFADVEPDTGLIDPAEVERRIGGANALSVVHYAGVLCDMPRLAALARRHRIPLVEDACHALDAEGYGGCAGGFGDIAAFSFHPVKPITTAEGGMAVTDSPRLAERMRTFRTHGIVKSPALSKRFGPWHNEMRELGYNYRLSDIQAALGLSQMRRADEFLERRRVIADRYDAAFAEIEGLRPTRVPAGVRSAYHLYPLLVDARALRGGRRAVVEAFHRRGILVQVHYIPVNAHPYYRRLGFDASDTPRAKAFGAGVLSFPLFAAMTDADAGRALDAARAVVRELKR